MHKMRFPLCIEFTKQEKTQLVKGHMKINMVAKVMDSFLFIKKSKLSLESNENIIH